MNILPCQDVRILRFPACADQIAVFVWVFYSCACMTLSQCRIHMVAAKWRDYTHKIIIMQITLQSIFKDNDVSLCVFTGKKFENTEMFGQYPLQVNGFKDLHECLEAAMIEGEIESLHSAENSAKSGQEVCREVVSFFSIPEHHNMLKHLKLFLFLRYSFYLLSNQSLRWRKRKHVTSDRDVT